MAIGDRASDRVVRWGKIGMRPDDLPSCDLVRKFILLRTMGFQHRGCARFRHCVGDAEDARDRIAACRIGCGKIWARVQRADAVVSDEWRYARNCSPLEGKNGVEGAGGASCWRMLDEIFPARPVVFCGIARPQNFLAAVTQPRG